MLEEHPPPPPLLDNPANGVRDVLYNWQEIYMVRWTGGGAFYEAASLGASKSAQN